MSAAIKGVGLFLLAVPGAMSCDLCAVYNASAARGESGAGFHLALAEQFTHSGTLQEEGSEIHDPIGQYRDSSITTLIAGYNVNERFGVSLNVPYIYRTFKRAEGFTVERGTESGLGDIALLGRFFPLIKRTEEYTVSVSLLGGVEFPTGDTDRLREEVNEMEVPGAPPSGVHGDDLTLGSGSFDGIIGTAASVRWRRAFFTADVQYFIRTRGDFGYQFGNEVSVAGGPGVYVFFKEEYTVALYAGFGYESKARDSIDGKKRDEGIIDAWYASPGVNATWGEHFSATFNVDIPLSIDNRAFQVVPDYRIRGGVSWSF